MGDLVKRLRNHIAVVIDNKGHVFESETLCDEAADRLEELEAKGLANRVAIMKLEAKLVKAGKIIAAAKEMYETAMLTGGGSPEAWANHVGARNAFASTLAELKGQDDE